jgi:hypothetical protein
MVDYEKIEAQQSLFNEKYGVNFDIYDFEGAINGFTAFGDTINPNDIYKTKFIIQAKKAFENFVDNKLENGLDWGEMIKDFEEMIMEPYRKECAPEYRTEPFGGWDTAQYLRSLKNFVDGVSSNKSVYAAERYMAGNLPIREMRAYAKELQDLDDTPSVEQLSTLYCYAKGLEIANQSRPVWWAMLHPIRFFAERREAKNFMEYVKEQKNVENMSILDRVRECAGDKTIENTKNLMKEAVEAEERLYAAQETNVPEESVDSPQKNVVSERISVPDAAMLDDSSKKSEQVTEAKPRELSIEEI